MLEITRAHNTATGCRIVEGALGLTAVFCGAVALDAFMSDADQLVKGVILTGLAFATAVISRINHSEANIHETLAANLESARIQGQLNQAIAES